MVELRALYYINQFYAGIGGEQKANIGLNVFEGPKGPGLGLEKLWDGKMKIVKTICCGDNFINNDEKYQSIIPDIKKIIDEVKPDVFIAGPAFNAGRYGVACAKMCDFIKREFKVPSIAGMFSENPAVEIYVKDIYIVPSAETASGMTKSLSDLAKLSLKLAQGKKLGPAIDEGYLQTGHRFNEYDEKTGAVRTVDLLMKKIKGEKYETEIPLRTFEKVQPAKPIQNIDKSLIALITTGGLVPKGNPDKLKQAFSVTFGRYSLKDIESMSYKDYESIHGGYDTTIVNEDPNRLLPLDEMLKLKNEGFFGELYDEFITTCGIGTNVKSSKDIGNRIADVLKQKNVQGVILTST
jgi:glycine reductase